MKGPRKAFLLAAGLGERMRPLSFDRPKPLMPLWGVPLLERMLDLLAGWGVEEFAVNIHHLPDQVFDAARAWAGTRNRPVNLSFEPEALGTGGALAKAGWFVGHEPFWLVNTDIAVQLDPAPLVAAFRGGRRLAALWLTDEKGPRTVEMQGGVIRAFRGARIESGHAYTFCGLHLVSPRVMEYLPPNEPGSIINAYERAMAAGETVAGVNLPGAWWEDVGSVDGYLRAHAGAPSGVAGRRHGGRGRVWIGAGAAVASGARLRDAVVWEGARLGPRARVEHAVVGRGARVDFSVTGAVVSASCLPESAGVRRLLAAMGWRAGDTAVCPLPVRGSDRAFARVAWGRRRAVCIEYGAQRPENAVYAHHARFLLKCGVPVPRVLADLPGEKLMAIEDAGTRSLEDAVKEGTPSPARWMALYGPVVDSVARWHGLAADAATLDRLQPPFTAELYAWERDLFARHCLCETLHLTPAAARKAAAALEVCERALLRQRPVLVHRDLQSSNILLRRGGHVFIDFQGMRLGAAAYDLASLLCDPYVMMPEEAQMRLLERYLARAPDASAVRGVFWMAAAQRLAQALGAFGRLSALPGIDRKSVV